MAHDAHYRFRGPEGQKEAFTDTCDLLKVPQNTVFLSLLDFFLSLSEEDRSRLVRHPTAARITFKK